MARLKNNASPELLDTIRGIENQADECWRPLRILQDPASVATWALLTGGVETVEREQAIRRINTTPFDMMLANIGRSLSVAVKWVIRHAAADESPFSKRWSQSRSSAVEQALAVAATYSHFEVCFQGFHSGGYEAEITGPASIRFSVPGDGRDHQVSAHQKGIRTRVRGLAAQRAEPPPQKPRLRAAFESVLKRCRADRGSSFDYGDAWDLWRELFLDYSATVRSVSRRPDSLSLGDYGLDEFNDFYAALMTICASHDFLCFQWGRTQGRYPIESAVLVRTRASWIETLSELSSVIPDKCALMVSDLVFAADQSVDLHVHPLVPLGQTNLLGLAPPFPLHSRHDENILRVCSKKRPQVYDATSLEKESEMLETVCAVGKKFGAIGPVKLPSPVPDIDLLAAEESSSTVIVAELKWIRKALRPAERPARDADVLKGVRQLQSIRAYLAENPDHLHSRGMLPRSLRSYEHVYFLLVPRDHWRWDQSDDQLPTVEFDAFIDALARSTSLLAAMTELLEYKWLPVEGRDFMVRYDRAELNGVSIESPVFYST